MAYNDSYEALEKSTSSADEDPAEDYILYAEDNATDAAFFTRCLRRTNPDIAFVHRQNGTLTKNFLEAQIERGGPLPRVVVLDIKMPGLSGLDVLEYIRETEELKYLPVIILSASSEKRDLRRAFHDHANAYLIKPERYHSLQDLVEAIVHFWMQLNQAPE